VMLFEYVADVVEVKIGEGEVVDIGGVFVGEDSLFSIVEAVGVGDGEVQEKKVDRGIGEESVACDKESAIVAGVLAEIAVLVGRRAGAVSEEVLRVEPKIAERTDEIDRERAVWG
jgi:hypothetical protein